MENKTSGRVHWSFWLIGVIALLWYLMGVANFMAQMSPTFVAKMPETHRTIIESRPVWLTVTFGIAVTGGALGCLLLLLKRVQAFYVFVLSLVAVVVTITPHLSLVGSVITDPFEIFMMIITSPLVSVLLVWYTKRIHRVGWLK